MNRINMGKPEVREISALKDSYKYVRINHKLYNGSDSISHQLYQLDVDPEETQDAANQFPSVTASFRTAAEEWYEDILQSGRAFQTPVFYLGRLSEPATFINGDAFSTKSPSLRRQGFPIGDWNQPGQFISYAVNVTEAGRYRVEMLFSSEPEGIGAEYLLGTEYDSAIVKISNENRVLSDWLELPAGRQDLKIQLQKLSPKGSAIRQFRHLIVHRALESEADGLPKNIGVAYQNSRQTKRDTVWQSHATIDFFTKLAMSGKLLSLGANDSLRIQPFCENEESLNKVIIWLDFEPILVLDAPLDESTISIPYSGRHTVNVEFVSKDGIKNTARFDVVKAENPISIWYGPIQRFGHLGEPQRWINVLGNIADPEQIDSVSFSINSNEERLLSLGSDLHRLALPGDFNVELTWDEVQAGENTLLIKAYPKNTPPVTSTIKLLVEKGNTWPLPYQIDFSKLNNLQDVVQIVDGHWRLEETGVRTQQRYYDRVLTMGDTTWSNFETTVRLTIHGFTPSEPGPPTYNVSHFGVAMRWRGHHSDGRQPSRKWFPLGAQGEFLLKDKLDSCQWRILFNGTPKVKPHKYSDKRNALPLGKPIRIKTQVVTMPDGRTRYRFKQWPDDRPEPPEWDVEGFETDDYPSGALCLVPHNSDVTIHELRVEPLVLSE